MFVKEILEILKKWKFSDFVREKKKEFLFYNLALSLNSVHPYKFHGRDMSGILFFIFASCEPLIGSISITQADNHLGHNDWPRKQTMY